VRQDAGKVSDTRQIRISRRPLTLDLPSAASLGEGRAFTIVASACVVLIFLALLQPLAGMFLHVSNDYGEGWNAYWSYAASHGEALYPTANPLVANNYPPLFFYAAGALGRLIGDDIFAGRILASAGLSAVAILIARIISLLGAPRRWAVMSAILFLAYDVVDFHPYVAVSNPQWPAQAIALASVLFLISDEPERLRARSVIAAAGLLILGGLFKHNQFAPPGAITIWLFVYNRRAFAIWCVSGAILAAASAVALHAFYGTAIFNELLGFRRTADWKNFFDGLGNTAQLGGLIIVVGFTSRRLRSHPRAMLFVLFAAIGVVSGAAQRLGAGVFLNAHFDGLIGLTIACGAYLGLSAAGTLPAGSDQVRRGRLLLLAVAPLLAWSPAAAVSATKRFIDLPEQTALWTDMISTVEAAHGPAFCELLSVCYWAGRPMGIDFFAYGQRLRTGADRRPLERLIIQRRATVLIIDRDARYMRGDGRLPSPLPFLIDRNYRPVIRAKRFVTLMLPRAR
jgi:hypothetical protein